MRVEGCGAWQDGGRRGAALSCNVPENTRGGSMWVVAGPLDTGLMPWRDKFYFPFLKCERLWTRLNVFVSPPAYLGLLMSKAITSKVHGFIEAALPSFKD